MAGTEPYLGCSSPVAATARRFERIHQDRSKGDGRLISRQCESAQGTTQCMALLIRSSPWDD